MSVFILAISCLTTSNTLIHGPNIQIPVQYYSLQHQTLLLSPVTSTTGHSFHFGSASSFFLELFLHWSPVAYWAPTELGSSSCSVLSFCLFILFMGFSRQEYWSGLPFLLQWTTFCQSSPPWPIHLEWPYMVLFIISLSELSTMTHLWPYNPCISSYIESRQIPSWWHQLLMTSRKPFVK